MSMHVYPINDWIDHRVEDNGESCPCEPEVKWIDEDGTPYDEPLVIHNALDGRE